VDATTVGNCIAHEHGRDGRVDPATLPTVFHAAYLGRYPSRVAYIQQRMDKKGWTKALTELGIEPYFDYAAYERDVFRYDVIAVDPGEDHRRDIEVFCRRTPGA
jgi:antirestriction protein